MRALDVLTDPLEDPDDDGGGPRRHLHVASVVVPPAGAAVWMGRTIRNHPDKAAALVGLVATGTFLAAVWPHHDPAPPVGMPTLPPGVITPATRVPSVPPAPGRPTTEGPPAGEPGTTVDVPVSLVGDGSQAVETPAPTTSPPRPTTTSTTTTRRPSSYRPATSSQKAPSCAAVVRVEDIVKACVGN